MIAKPEDARQVDPEEGARRLARELYAIEHAHGLLDRHAAWRPNRPHGKTLDALKQPRFQPPSRSRNAGSVGRLLVGVLLLACVIALAWARTR